jgi:uncharacterized C2H2 Zn-finger protein
MAQSQAAYPLWLQFFPLILIVVAAVVVAFAGRRKMLKCPDCGTVFNAPALDKKRSGLGWTIPYLGVVKCPKCGQSRGRRDYQTVKVKQPNYTGTLPQPGSQSP